MSFFAIMTDGFCTDILLKKQREKKMKKIVLSMLCVFAGVTSVANAGFDVIAFGDVGGGQLHFHGATYVGGNVLNAGICEFGNDKVNFVDGYSVVVAGNFLTGQDHVNSGKALYGGTSSVYVQSQDAGKYVKDTTGQIASYGINKQDYVDLSQSYLLPTSKTIDSLVNITFESNTHFYSMSESVFETFVNNSFTFNGFSDSGDSIVINVSGKDIYMNSTANFNDPGSFSSRITWNFYEAKSVDLKGFYGNILAPNATYNQTMGSLYGKLVCNSIIGDGELHIGSGDYPDAPTPTVPAPSAIALAAFGVVSMARRRFVR